MLPTAIDGVEYCIHQATQDLSEIDLIAWLASHPLYPKVFWKEKSSSVARATVGSVLTFPQIPTFTNPTPLDLRFYGGIRFDAAKNKDQVWQEFLPCSFWLPLIEITQNASQAQAQFFSLNESPNKDLLGKINPSRPQKNTFIEKSQTPDFSTWKQNVTKVLQMISSGQLDKAVLGRRTSYQFSNPLSPWPLLADLCQRAHNATLFAFQLSPDVCFMGATPEKLFQREGTLLSTKALAGTRSRGQSLDEDLKFEKELLCSDKDQREFKFVKDYLSSSLSALSENIQWEGPDHILKTSHVQHLYNQMHAKLKNGVSDADLIAALHPTPALGGYPRDKALECLSELEAFDRGWYGAPVGVISPKQSNLYVAIRSGLISHQTLHLFAGTGIVQGSIAEKEWEELEMKIRPFTELIT